MRSIWSHIIRCIFFALLCCGLFTPVQSQAQDLSGDLLAVKKKPKKKSSPSFYVPNASTPATRSYTPSFVRPEIAIAGVLGYQYIGLGIGVETWIAWPQNFQLGLSYVRASGEITSKADANIGLQEVLDIEMNTITPTVRYFSDDSFFFSFGYVMANATGKFGYKTIGGGTQNTFVAYKSNISLAQIGFGSFWRLLSGNVVVIDWLGYGHLIGQKVSMGEDKPAFDGSTVEQNVQFFESTTTEEHLKKQLKDQIRLYGMLLRFGIQF